MRYCRLIVLVLRDAEIIRLAHSVNVALPQLLMINHSQTHAHIEKKIVYSFVIMLSLSLGSIYLYPDIYLYGPTSFSPRMHSMPMVEVSERLTACVCVYL